MRWRVGIGQGFPGKFLRDWEKVSRKLRTNDGHALGLMHVVQLPRKLSKF